MACKRFWIRLLGFIWLLGISLGEIAKSMRIRLTRTR